MAAIRQAMASGPHFGDGLHRPDTDGIRFSIASQKILLLHDSACPSGKARNVHNRFDKTGKALCSMNLAHSMCESKKVPLGS